MTELELLQQISDKLTQQNTLLTQVIDMMPNASFLTGILTGILIGFIFWNVVKEVAE